jgi:uncharacterized protein YjiS (DUF1127 family)
MLTSITQTTEPTIMTPHPHAFGLLPRPPAARAAAALGHLWRALVDFLRVRGTADQKTRERDALADLDERMLKDIGASQWQAADAAMRSYEDLRTRISGGLG